MTIKKRKAKYNNKIIKVDGITYHSQGEYARECVLKNQLRSNIISNLKRQVKFKIEVNGVQVCDYIADWTYNLSDNNGTYVVEDFKGFKTSIFLMKAKLLKACYGIDIWCNKNINAHCANEYPY